jgi:ATP-dependent Lhr-like helicase
MADDSVLAAFHPLVRRWFERAFGMPSPPQVLGWPSIGAGKSTLILAPTGSGKTLAAFLWAINHCVEQRLRGDTEGGIRIVYVSPLKALNNDIERNLQAPLEGIREEAHRQGLRFPGLRTAVRTGDTPQAKRASMLRHPPDILITTPESLYLMLTARLSRKMFTTVQYVIVDEIHSICGNKRGVHLSLSLERLQEIAEQDIIRIGLSATQRPLETIAAFLGGLEWRNGETVARPVAIVNAGQRKTMDLRVECAPNDFALLPQDSVWPLVFGEILDLIRRHQTTLVFVNNRRLAERVAAKLNEMVSGDDNEGYAAGSNFNMYAVPHRTASAPGQAREVRPGTDDPSPFVQAYHGSMSRQARERMERELKEGKIRALIATSSLELGIDIGSIDLVIQLQSPKGVARGLQRVGRSGHLVTAQSKGRIYPTHREDLVESTVVARAMMAHDVELTTVPTDCLDVLAQQIVAMVSVEVWDTDALFDLVRRSYCYRNLSRELYVKVLQMLAGRYAAEEFRELRPRISWDKVNNLLRPLPGSGRLAIMGGGTIADRGYFGVYLEDGKTRVGEVDEEFVFETRSGDTFILGSSVWRVVTIDANRVLVAPAPGQPARMPFWRGEGIGRSYELGEKIGEFRRVLAGRIDEPDCLTWLQSEFPIDARSAWNILDYFRRQRAITGIIPGDRLLLVEGFRDELGDPRVVVHSALGRRVNGLLGFVLAHRLHASAGVEPQMLYNDDGIMLRCADLSAIPLDLLQGLTVREAEELVLEEILSSPLFGGQFRQNAARALLMPRPAPGKRTPLWLQRLRAADLLQVARQSGDFPLVIETVREVLNDVLDFEHFKEIVQNLERGTIEVRTVQSEIPSPFAASLLFNFIAVYMYEWDQPRADRLSQYVAINRELLADVVDLDTIASLVRPDAVSEVERELQHAAPGYRARSAEELAELLVRLGDLTEQEVLERCEGDGREMLRQLFRDGRALQVEFPDGKRWIAGEDAELYAQISSEENARGVLRRYLLNHGPVGSSQLAGRFGLPRDRVESLAAAIADGHDIIRGAFLPPGSGDAGQEQWCYRPNIERIHRKTIGILRREITPSSPSDFVDFLLHWQHADPSTRGSGVVGLTDSLEQLQGLPLPTEIWERDILRLRVDGYSTSLQNDLTRQGEVLWVGEGAGKMACIFRGEGGCFPGSVPSRDALSVPAVRVLEYLEQHGASFVSDLRLATHLSLAALNAGMAELFWGGWITNDVFSELTGIRRSIRMAADAPMERMEVVRRGRSMGRHPVVQAARRAISQVPGWAGRWSLVRVPAVMGPDMSEEERAEQQARQMLARYGIVAREFHRREEMLPWVHIAAEMQRMEMRGEIRRGYFVEGLSGMQFALPGAVDALRGLKSASKTAAGVILMNSCDPANLYGTGIEFPGLAGQSGALQVTRLPGNFIAFAGGVPMLWIEGEGSRIRTIGRPDTLTVTEALERFLELVRLPAALRPLKTVTVEYWDGERPAGSAWAGVLRSLGFSGDANQTMRYDSFSRPTKF